MSTENPPPTPDGAPPPGQEPDQIFRLQVAVSEFFVGNARNFGIAVIVVLLGIGLYGAWEGWQKSKAEDAFGAIATIDYKMPKAAEMSEIGLVPADDPNDAARLANVRKGAELYEEAAKTDSGTAAVYAWAKAAETWTRLGENTRALDAWKAAHDVGADELPGFVAATGYAAALADAGRGDDAIGVLRTYSAAAKDFYAEESLIRLAQLQADAGKTADAQLVIDEFRRRFPDSPRTRRLAGVVAPTPQAATTDGSGPATGSGG